MIDLQIAFAGLREMYLKNLQKATFEVTSQEMFDCKIINIQTLVVI